MLSKRTQKGIIISAVILMATVAVAFAHGFGYGGPMMGYGSGYGGNMMGYGGYQMGPGMMGYGGYGGNMMGYGAGSDRGYGPNLSSEEIAKLDAAREKFFNDTSDLRNQIEEKRLNLGNEIDKANPDATKVAELQKELSKLDSEFDQKSVQFQLEVRKLLPEKDLGSGYGRGFGNGRYCR